MPYNRRAPKPFSANAVPQSGLDRLLTKHRAAVTDHLTTGNDLPDAAYEDFYEYFLHSGEMPYGTAKARDGDPYQWIANRLAEETSSLPF